VVIATQVEFDASFVWIDLYIPRHHNMCVSSTLLFFSTNDLLLSTNLLMLSVASEVASQEFIQVLFYFEQATIKQLV